MNLYQLSAFLRYPEVQQLTTELWYLDQNELVRMKFTRKQRLHFFKNWNDRMLRMTSETEFHPKPSTHNCRFCPYMTRLIGKQGPMGTGHCDRNPD